MSFSLLRAAYPFLGGLTYVLSCKKNVLRVFFSIFFGSPKIVKTTKKRTKKTITKRFPASPGVKKRSENGDPCKKNDSKTVSSGDPVFQ